MVAAEGLTAPRSTLLASSLQWGRGLVAAEGRLAGCGRHLRLHRLQWGRGLVAAEGLPDGLPTEFLKTASMGPRLGGRGRKPPAWPCLAWSTRFNGAAAWWPRKDVHQPGHAVPLLASMGPRLGGRGRSRVPGCGRSCPPLQWGRGLVAAEGHRGNPPRSGVRACFNGAAAWWPRKGGSASRGWLRRPSFNGAAAWWPRKGGAGQNWIRA